MEELWGQLSTGHMVRSMLKFSEDIPSQGEALEKQTIASVHDPNIFIITHSY